MPFKLFDAWFCRGIDNKRNLFYKCNIKVYKYKVWEGEKLIKLIELDWVD